MKITPRLLLACTLGMGFTACATDDGVDTSTQYQVVAGQYIVSCTGRLPSSFGSTVAANGDSVVHQHNGAGFAVVDTDSPDSYATAGCMVTADITAQFVSPSENVTADFGNPPTSGDDDFLFDLQWGHDAVNAPEAWNHGIRGAGARVAVLDTGFDLDHPDLAPNINFALSRDFTGEGLQYSLPNPFSHGTHTSGTVAAADNAFGSIGVAPEAELVLIKVLGDTGGGSFGDVMAGMLYAADVGADVASMSLGALFPRREDIGLEKVGAMMNRVTNYMYQHGTLVIAAAGNDETDFDHTADMIQLPAHASHVVSISATAPIGWAVDPSTSLDNLASYSNYGTSGVDFAGPGGDFQYALVDPSQLCTVGGITRACYVFDFVLSTGNGGWYWSAGTSMATPHVAGVAALLISEGVANSPATLEAALRARADDLGKPGADPIYGLGRAATGY